MAKKKTKAEVIREYLQLHPQTSPTELARIITTERPEIKVVGQEISKYRRKEKKKAAPSPQQPAPAATQQPAAGPPISELLCRLKVAVEAVGGKEEARRLLDLLS